MIDLSFKNISGIWQDETACRKLLEEIRWGDEPCCPRCGTLKPYKIISKPTSKYKVRDGLYKCRDKKCRKPFTVTVGTVFEDAHIKLGTWFMAFALMNASKKGMSALQLSRELEVTYKTAWYMCHRVRLAMSKPAHTEKLTGTVEVDETYIGGKRKGIWGRPVGDKFPVVSLVQRGGDVRSFPVDRVTAKNLKGLIREHVHPDSIVMTDGFVSYEGLAKEFASHKVINHAEHIYAQGDVYTNTVEGYFSILKRGVMGTYHHISYAHLLRYLAEFDFRYNARKSTDAMRTLLALQGFEGRRLTYK